MSRTVARSRLHELEGAANHFDVAEVFSAPGRIDTVFRYVREHPPPGAAVIATGYDGRRGQPPYDRWVEFAKPALAAVLADRHLYVSVSSTGPGQTKVFAQAESIWISARPKSERIPTATRQVVVRITQANHPERTKIVSRPRIVDQVVADFNTVETVQPDQYNCGMTLSPVSFSYGFMGANGSELAHVTYTVMASQSPGPCNPMTISIAGRRRTALLGGPQIIRVQRLLGVSTLG